MSDSWPMVLLGNVIRQRKEFTRIDDLAIYKRCRVQLHAKGIVLRDIVEGQSLKTKEQQVCRAGEFLVAEIDAKVGGFGIVPQELEGAIVSSHYFLFVVDEAALDRRFLGYFIQTPAFQDQVTAQGSTNYAAIRPQHVLDYRIPLPPLPEQRHIVARIEELAALIEEARLLRARAREEVEVLPAAAVRTVFDNHQWAHINVGELVGQENLRNGKSVKGTDLSADIHCLRLSSLRGGRIDCTDAKPVPMTRQEAEPYLIRVGDVFIVRGSGSKTLVGRAGQVEECVEGTIFPDLLIRVPLDKNRILPTFFVGWWNSPQMHSIIEDAARTTSGIWKVNQKHIASFSVPLPPLSEQCRIVAYLDRLQAQVDELTALQETTQAELDALLPAVLERAFRGEL